MQIETCIACEKGINIPSWASRYILKGEEFVCSSECMIKWVKNHAENIKSVTPAMQGATKLVSSKDYKSKFERAVAASLVTEGMKFFYEGWGFELDHGTYTPDFYLPLYNCFLEVKGNWATGAKNKMRRFRECFPDVRLLIVPWTIRHSFHYPTGDIY